MKKAFLGVLTFPLLLTSCGLYDDYTSNYNVQPSYVIGYKGGDRVSGIVHIGVVFTPGHFNLSEEEREKAYDMARKICENWGYSGGLQGLGMTSGRLITREIAETNWKILCIK